MYDKRMDNLPLFISYPRTGSHWINCISEIYFDRPRLREGRTTFLNSNRKDWMWFHDHDLELDIVHNNVLYLYRDPVETVYSYAMAQTGRTKEPFVIGKSKLYNKHLKKYLLNKKAKVVVAYENFKKDFDKEYEKVSEFFGVIFDAEKLTKAKETVNKKSLINISRDKKFINNKLVSKKYNNERIEFASEYGERIKEIVITPDLEEFFYEDEKTVNSTILA